MALPLSTKNRQSADRAMKKWSYQNNKQRGCGRRFVTTSAIYGPIVIQSFQQKFSREN